MASEPGRLGRRLGLALVAALLVGVGGVIGIAANGGTKTGQKHDTAGTPTVQAAPVDPHVAAGAHDFVQFACGQCHGEQGRGGVSPDVPSLTGVAQQLTAPELRSIIDHGLGASGNPAKPYMPVWGAVISKTQVSDLIAYLGAGLPAVPTAVAPAVPQNQGAAVEGAVLYQGYGCVNCHGPNGLGGVPNPGSPDKTIPPLSGSDFRAEFNTDQKIIAVIRSGSVLGRAPIVSMPHWGGIIPDQRLHAIVAYIHSLK